MEGLKTGDIIKLFVKKKWHDINVKLVGHSATTDITVFAINEFIGAHPVQANMGGITMGQDVYFLGFPYGMSVQVDELNPHMPFPLIKKAILSAYVNEESLLILDGINNPGFSGGPVIFRDGTEQDFKFAGVISGYRSANQNALIDNKPSNIQIRENTGIVLAYSIKAAKDLIAKNPVGAVRQANSKG